MESKLDEARLSFPINIWNKMLYENVLTFHLDIYYNDKGFPANIHDAFGAEGVDDFRYTLMNQILNKNEIEHEQIWRISSDAFAIVSEASNCGFFDFDYKGHNIKVMKKTAVLTLV